MNFLGGLKNQKDCYKHDGILSYMQLSNEQKYVTSTLFDSSDELVLKYQSWKNSAWGRVFAVIDAINNKKPLIEIFKLYLKNVPDNLPEKVEILDEVEKI